MAWNENWVSFLPPMWSATAGPHPLWPLVPGERLKLAGSLLT